MLTGMGSHVRLNNSVYIILSFLVCVGCCVAYILWRDNDKHMDFLLSFYCITLYCLLTCRHKWSYLLWNVPVSYNPALWHFITNMFCVINTCSGAWPRTYFDNYRRMPRCVRQSVLLQYCVCCWSMNHTFSPHNYRTVRIKQKCTD